MIEQIPTLTELFDFVKKSILENEFAQGGAIMAVMTSVLYGIPKYLIPLFQFLYNRIERLVVYHVNIEQTDDLYAYFEMWLSDNYKQKYRNVEAALKMNVEDWGNYDVLSGEEVDIFSEKVIYKQYEDTFVIRRGLSFIRVFKGREKLENASSLKTAHYNKFKLSGVFAKRRINKLINEVHKDAQRKMKEARIKSIRVKISTQHGDWIDQNVVEPKDMKNIIIDCKESILEDINIFLSKREYYKKRNILYKRGYLFSGAAGTGKTSFTLSLAKYLDRTVYMLQLNNLDDEAIRAAFKQIPPNSILLVEDIDSAFKKRDSGEDDMKFSFSTLLNCLDGVFATEDVIVVFTTNHREKLDHALLRKGRIDVEEVFKRPSIKEVKQYLDIFYECDVTVPFEIHRVLPMVDIQDACLRNMDSLTDALKEIEINQQKVIDDGVENLVISVENG